MKAPALSRVARLGAIAALLLACGETATGPGALRDVQQPRVSATASVPAIYITEFLSDPTKVADAAGEWFEVFNAGDTPVDLLGWRITSFSGESHTINASVVVPAGGFAVLGNNTNPATNGGATVNYSYGTSITLNNSNTDWLALKLPDLTTVDSVSYSGRDASGTIIGPNFTPTAGRSRELTDIGLDNSTAATNWANSTTTFGLGDFGTPGTGPYADVGPVASVTVTPAADTVEVGGTVAFTATGFDALNRPSPTTFTWSSNDPSIATVNPSTGVATGVAEGTATITATSANNVVGSATLVVTEAPPPPETPAIVITEFMADPSKVGDTAGEWMELFNAGDEPVDLNGWRITSGPTGSETHLIATSLVVPAGGFVVLGNNSNSTTNGGVTVNYSYGTSITLNNSNTDWITLKLPTGTLVDSVAYSARSGATVVSPSYSPSAGISRVLIDAAKDNSIAATADWQDTPATDTYGLGDRGTPGTGPYAPIGPVATVTVTPASASINVSQTQAFSAAGFDSNGQPSPTTFTWSSDNPSVATVDANGIATAVAVGAANITATSANGMSGAAALTVTEPPPPPSGLVITEILIDPAVIPDAAGEWFEVFNLGSDPVDLQGWRIVSVTGSPPIIEEHVIASSVVVPAGGFVVLGNNTNSATNGGVNVAYSWGTDITLSNSSSTEWLALRQPDGTTEDSVAYAARDASGNLINPIYAPQSGVAREVIDALNENVLLAGSNWRNATLSYGTGSNKGTPGFGRYGTPGPIATIHVTPSIAGIAFGTTQAFSALAVDALGRIVDPTFAWSSSNTDVATIDATGLATGITIGSVTITASADGVDGTAILNVTDPNAPATITVNFSDPQWLPAGYMKRIFTTVLNAGGTSVPAELTYTVSDPSLAEIVDFDGRIYLKTLAEGTVVVTATAENAVFGQRSLPILPADAPTTALYRNHLEFGTPSDADPSDDILIARRGFTASFNATRGGPNWVSWNINATHFGPVPRCDCFSPDTELPSGIYPVFDPDYINGGYDRGHMVQSESRTTTEQENAATFLFTNILPQAANNNQGPWLDFENELNDLARVQGKDVYVVAGGQYAPSPPTLKDEGKVAIPDYTWKVAIVMPSGQGLAQATSYGSLQVVAVRIPNLTTAGVPASAANIRNTPWETFRTTVDSIEEAVGYDVFAALPDWLERIVESGDRPPVANIGGPYSGEEGSAISFAASATDPDAGDVLTYDWSFGDGGTDTGASPAHTYSDDGNFNVRLIVSDSYGAADTVFTTVAVSNAAPSVTSLTVPTTAYGVGASVPVSLTYSDAGSADTHQIVIAWGDGTTTTLAGTAGGATSTHAYAATGFYTVQVTVEDDDGAQAGATATSQVIVFGAGGTANGSASIDSPPGAVAFNPTASGKGNLNFDTKYLPDGRLGGSLDYNISGANIRFSADTFEWLVVTGSAGVLRGTGRFRNRPGTLTYTLTMVDGDVTGGDGVDRARLRIVDSTGAVVYDNMPGAPLSATAAVTGGNITVR